MIIPLVWVPKSTRRMYHGHRGRWLTEREKMAASGLAVSSKQAAEAGIQQPAPWWLDMGWHMRVGNGNQLQNIGLILMAVLASVRIRDKAPSDLLEIQAPSYPDGLSVVGKNYMLLVGNSSFEIGNSKATAHEIHKKLHAA